MYKMSCLFKRLEFYLVSCNRSSSKPISSTFPILLVDHLWCRRDVSRFFSIFEVRIPFCSAFQSKRMDKGFCLLISKVFHIPGCDCTCPKPIPHTFPLFLVCTMRIRWYVTRFLR